MDTVFELGTEKHTVKLNFDDIEGKLKDFGIDVIELFTKEEEADKFLSRFMMDDMFAADIMLFYVNKTHPEMQKKDLLRTMGSFEPLDGFRNAFWGGIVNFSSPLKKTILTQMWEKMKQMLVDPELLDRMLSAQSSNGKPSQDIDENDTALVK